MNWDIIKGNWKQLTGTVQSKWGELTNDDIDVIKGDQTVLTGKLQEKYGWTKNRAEKEIEDWRSTLSRNQQ